MNKKEKDIILNTYKDAYHLQDVTGCNNYEAIRSLSFMLDTLKLKKERYMIENEIIVERNNISFKDKYMYSMIFETFVKYGVYVNYDLNDIEQYYYDLQYKMTDEDKMCHRTRISNIEGNKVA